MSGSGDANVISGDVVVVDVVVVVELEVEAEAANILLAVRRKLCRP